MRDSIASNRLNISVKRSVRTGMSLRGLSTAGGCRWFTWFLHVFEHESLRVLILHLGDQGIAVHVLPLAEISGLEWRHYEHRQNIEESF